MNKRFMRCMLHFTCSLAVAAAFGRTVSVKSPDGRIAFSVETEGRLSYSLAFNGKTLIAPSAMGFEFKGESPMADGFTLAGEPKVESGLVEAWKSVVKNRHADGRIEYNRLTLPLREADGARRRMDVTVHVSDDGAAFRYTLYGSERPGERLIVDERTEYRVPETSFAWVGHNQGGGSSGSQESVFVKTPVTDIGADDWCLVPLLVEVDRSNYLAITSANLDNYPGFLAAWRNGAIATRLCASPSEGDAGVKARFDERFDTAWRVVMVADNPGRFVETEMLRALSAPCAIQDTSWIRPGLSAWDHWWSGEVKMDMPTAKEYIDLAAAEGWPYMLVDWQWYGKFNVPEADITKSAPQMDIPALIAYAKERGVRLWLWLYSSDATRNDAFREAFALYAKWGVAGVKIDFMDRYDREIVNWYRRMAKCAADNRLMLDFHGAYVSDGLERTYPNIMTREAVKGAEYSKFSDDITPAHNVTLAFTRLIAGPMDYTPGAFLNVPRENFRQGSPTVVMNTRAAELAKFVVYESPYMVCCDHPTNILGKVGADFLKEVPAEWDDTRFLGGYPGEWVAIARRSADRWFVGAMGGDDAREVEIDLSSLCIADEGRIWCDSRKVAITTEGGILRVPLAPGGGFVAVFPCK